MKYVLLAVLALSFGASADEYLGQYTVNPYAPQAIASDPFGDIPQTYNAPKLFDSQGNYRGKLSNDKYSLDSISNPYGKYGSEYSLDSVNNPYGAGSTYKLDSPTNPYGTGWSVYSDDY